MAHLDDVRFQRKFRLSRSAFRDLCVLLGPHLTREGGRGGARAGHAAPPLSVETKLSVALRFLAGASVEDLDRYGVERKSSIMGCCVWPVVGAIHACPELDFRLLRALISAKAGDSRELKEIQAGFDKKYFALTWLGVAGADQCVACRHGRRSAPQRGEGGAAYARAATHPLWCRAGSFSTARTCRPADKATLCELACWIEENGLSQGCWLNADEAFKGSESCVTPYPGSVSADHRARRPRSPCPSLAPRMRHLACTGKANFNHFKSSLRMPVEQCFGRNLKLPLPSGIPLSVIMIPPSVAIVAGVFWRPSRMSSSLAQSGAVWCSLNMFQTAPDCVKPRRAVSDCAPQSEQSEAV